MVEGLNVGPMVLTLKGSISSGIKRAQGSYTGLTAARISVNSTTTNLAASGATNGAMAECTKVNGSTTACTEREPSSGMTVGAMRANTNMT